MGFEAAWDITAALKERGLGETLWGYQRDSLPSYSSPFVLFLMSLLQVSRICFYWAL